MNAEARVLIDRAREELNACDLLMGEQLFSQAVSRAYLAMLHVSEALMVGEGLDYSTESGARAAFGQLLLKFGGVDPRFHGHIFTAFRQRQAADRRPPAQVSTERAHEAVAQAREFLEMAESYLDEQGSVSVG